MSTARADTILQHGTIYTLDSRNTLVSALAIGGRRILALGDEETVGQWKGRNTEVIDLQGQWVFPGFTESHGHLLWIGEMRTQVDVGGIDDINRVGDTIAQKAAGLPEGQWIRGHSWTQKQWGAEAYPDHRVLTQAAPNHPVLLTRIDGHSCWVNRRALELAGIDANTPDPAGGVIVRDASGNPTGILVDRAMTMVESCIPEPGEAEKRRLFEIGQEECLRYGVTAFHEARTDAKMAALFRRLDQERALKFRLYVMLDAADEELLRQYYAQGPLMSETGHLTIRAIKLFVDGALGSRGALLFDDYVNDPGNRGTTVRDEDDVYEHCLRALRHGFQVCTHAIGDRANRMTLDSYERALRGCLKTQDLAVRSNDFSRFLLDSAGNGRLKSSLRTLFRHALRGFRSDGKMVDNHRFRIEHGELLSREDIPRFARLGVIASMQATHCTSDIRWLEGHIGTARAAERLSPWRSLLDSGAVIAGGSDTPIESTNPLVGVYASVTRMSPEGSFPGAWVPQQCMTREEALRSYTTWAAYAAFEENERGSLEVGKLADLVVLSRDVMEIPAEELLTTDVLLTMVGGQVVYRTLRAEDL